MKKVLLFIISLALSVTLLVACNENDEVHQHTVVIDEAVDSTCNKTGLTAGAHCAECGEILVVQSEISLKDHVYDDEYDAFCNVCGCERDAICNHMELETIPGKVATCTAEGTTDGKMCANCAEVIVEQTTIPTNDNHSYENRICIDCGALYYSDGLAYELNGDGTCYIIGKGECTDTEVYIPPCIDGYKVIGIGYEAFRWCDDISSVVIPDGVVYIDAFAFIFCGNLVSIDIPNSVIKIGDYALNGCASLESIIVGNENPIYYSSGNCLIETISKTLIAGCNNSVIPADGTVTQIGRNAFWGCINLTTITIPGSVTDIGREAFSGCYGLTTVVLADGIINIEDYAFAHCANLADIVIPDSVMNIGNCAFDDTAYFNNASNWDGGVLYIGNYLIKASSDLTDSYIIKSGTKIVADNAFEECINLTAVVIPESVVILGKYSFLACGGLTSAVVPNGVLSIGEGAFGGCISLTNIIIPDSVKTIGEYAFQSCIGLVSLSIGNGDVSIGAYAFANCSNLVSVTIGNGAVIIGSYAFWNCTALKDIVFCIGVTYIGEAAFSGCSSLISIVIPESVKVIERDAFSYCSRLNKIVIPNGVTSIGDGVFSCCTNLAKVEISDSVTSIGYAAFYGCSNLASIVIPESVISIGQNAFFGCSNLTKVIFEHPDGWWYSSSDTATSGTSIVANELSNEFTAAKYLVNMYECYLWKRS